MPNNKDNQMIGNKADELYMAIAKFGILDAARRGLLSGLTTQQAATASGLFEGSMDLYSGVIENGTQRIQLNASVIIAPLSIPAGKTSWKVEVPESLRGSLIRTLDWSGQGAVAVSQAWTEEGTVVQWNIDEFTDAIWMELNNTSDAPVVGGATLMYGGTVITKH